MACAENVRFPARFVILPKRKRHALPGTPKTRMETLAGSIHFIVNIILTHEDFDMPKSTPYTKRLTKSQLISALAEDTDLTRADVQAVLDSMANQAKRHLKKGACGEFVITDLGVKMKRVTKPARKAQPGVNPFTGEKIMLKARPASKSVRVVALKAAKEMAG